MPAFNIFNMLVKNHFLCNVPSFSKGIVAWLFYFLIFIGLLGQTAIASILVVSGDGQKVIAGVPSNDVVFKVLDELGKPVTSGAVTVTFTLTNPTGIVINGLSVAGAIPSTDTGQVSTKLQAIDVTRKAGNYTITAILISDTKQRASTNIVVVAAPPAQLIVSAGGKQNLFVGTTSADVVFQLTDVFGNPVVNQTVTFALTTPPGSSGGGLTRTSAATDINGQVSTAVTTAQTTGNYTITAKLATDSTITASTETILATDPLPPLGFGGAMNANGSFLSTTAIFNGGVSINGGDFQQETVQNVADLQKSPDSVVIRGIIKVDTNHVGLNADLLVVAGYTPASPHNAAEQFVMLDSAKQIRAWDMRLASLVPFMPNVTLSALQTVDLFKGNLPYTGKLRIFFGYRLANGVVVYNANQSINMVINQ